jgi:hypothetical protein
MRHKKFIFTFFLMLLLGLGSYGAFNYAVDPFQYYRIPTLYRPVFWGGLQRQQNAGIARNYAADVVVVGSSVTENFLPSHIKRSWGANAAKLSISGSTGHEQALVLRLALNTGKVRHVLWGLDTGAFYGDPAHVRDDQAPFPFYLYSTSPLPNLSYLLSFGTFRFSVLALKGYGITDLEKYHVWYGDYEFSKKSVLAAWKGRCEDFGHKFIPLPKEAMDVLIAGYLQSLDENLVNLTRGYPDVTFDLFFPPSSLLTYIPFDSGELASYLAFREALAHSVVGLKNVRLYDFQSVQSVVANLDNYKDQIHFGLNISDVIIDAIRDRRQLIDPADINKQNKKLIELAEHFSACSLEAWQVR